MSVSSIEWTEQTWNPVRGCSPVSPGCKNCYAERTAGRFCKEGEPFHEFVQIGKNGEPGPHWTGEVELIAHMLDVPLRRKIPTTYFVNSMSDLFHEGLPIFHIAAVFAVAETCQQHTFQILTKRGSRMREMLSDPQFYAGWVRKAGYDIVGPKSYMPRNPGWPLPNVHLGVSVEDRQRKDRIDELRETPAAVRFLSVEPLLEDLGTLDLRSIDGVIVGGESGPGARPMHPDWARGIRDQCVAAGVAFFFKQWGEVAPWDASEETRSKTFILLKDGSRGTLQDLDRDARPNFLRRPQIVMGVGKKRAGRLLDGREWNQLPVGIQQAPNRDERAGRMARVQATYQNLS